MVLGRLRVRHQALSDSLALRDLFTSLFFVSIGMLLDFRTGFDQPGMVAGVVAIVLLGKAAIAAFAGLMLRFPVRVALLAGFGVAQIGEFSFVLGRQGADFGLLTADELRVFFAASVVTMFIAPLALRFGPGVAARASRLGGLGRFDSVRAGEMAVPPGAPRPAGRRARVWRRRRTARRSASRGGDAVCRARSEWRTRAPGQAPGTPLYYGDVTSREILERAGVASAAQVVVVLKRSARRRCMPSVWRARSGRRRSSSRGRVTWERRRRCSPRAADEVVAQELEASFTIIERVTREARLPKPHHAGPQDRLPPPRCWDRLGAVRSFPRASRSRAPWCPRTRGWPAGA